MTGADLAAAAEAAQRSFAGVGDSALDNAYALPAPPEATPPPEPLARATLSPKKTPKAKRGVGAASGQARVVSEQVDAGGVLTSKSRRPKAKAGVAAEAATDDGAQLSDGARTLLDWMLGAHARRTYETSPLGAMHAAAPVAAQATLFDSPPAPTSPTKPALPGPGRPGADPDAIESNPLFARIRGALHTPRPQHMDDGGADRRDSGTPELARPVAERLVGTFFWLSVLPLCCIIWGAYIFPEANRSNQWVPTQCEVLRLQTDVGTGPACHVRAAVRLPAELGGWTVETRPAACYRDWGCREGLSDDSKRASCEAVFACGGNGTHPAPGCTAPCFQNESGLIPQVALENLYDVGEMGMFLCALLVPVMLLAWLRFWALVVARAAQPPASLVDEEAPCACGSLGGAVASLQCCRASRNGVVWPVAVLAAVYLVLGLTGLAIVIDAADSFTQCAADGIILAPAALEVMMAALLFVYALAPVAPAQRPELLLQFAVAPRVLQLVLAFVSLVAVGTATGQSAYDCSNHRLYVYEFLFAVGNMLVAGLALTYFVVLTPLTGYALPLPQYRRSRSGAGGLAGPPRVCPGCCHPHTDYRLVAAAAMAGALVFALGLVGACVS